MLELTKNVLKSVSFDKSLFKKELNKSLNWVGKDDYNQLKVWCLATFAMYSDVINDVFQS
ncbi:MAG: hypothetical protein ACI8Q1_000502 [Parvicella sp.]|jgi:hypothetical protein